VTDLTPRDPEDPGPPLASKRSPVPGRREHEDGRGRWRRSGDDGEGTLRGLLGAGRSKVSLSSAMRVRDVAPPDAAQLAEADRLVAQRIAADRARSAQRSDREAGGRWRRIPRPGPPSTGRPAGPAPGFTADGDKSADTTRGADTGVA
jgi:hypothetical protein